ncbi:MAG: hypothetical protein ABIV05_02855 [Actinomycetota bacterium]
MSRLVQAGIKAARRLPWLREQAGRAVDAVVRASSVPPPALRPGAWSHGLGTAADDLPVVVVDVTGLATEPVQALVDRLPEVAPGVRFVLVVDGPQLAVGRRAGVVVEHLIDPRAWARRHDPAGWPAYRSERFDQMRSTYRPHQVVALASGDADELGRALVAAPAQAAWRRAWSRAERLLDPPPRGRAAPSPRR